MVKQRERSAQKAEKRTNNRWGAELIRLAMELSRTADRPKGRSMSMVYAVLNGKGKSAPVSRAIEEARARLRNQRRRVA